MITIKGIKHEREASGMTQAQLADTLGVSRAAVAMWETGKTLPRADLLPQIAQILGCTIDDLYETKSDKEAHTSEQ